MFIFYFQFQKDIDNLLKYKPQLKNRVCKIQDEGKQLNSELNKIGREIPQVKLLVVKYNVL